MCVYTHTHTRIYQHMRMSGYACESMGIVFAFARICVGMCDMRLCKYNNSVVKQTIHLCSSLLDA